MSDYLASSSVINIILKEKNGHKLSIIDSCGNILYSLDESDKGIIFSNLGEASCCFLWKLNLTVKGDVKSSCFARTEDSTIRIEGNAFGSHVGSCMKNNNMVIDGYAEDSLGSSMEDSTIFVGEYVRDSVGRNMKTGNISVKGNARDYVGCCMKDGSITIKGTARYSVGEGSEGGTIEIGGDFGSIANNAKAKIIWDDRIVGALVYASNKVEMDKIVEIYLEE